MKQPNTSSKCEGINKDFNAITRRCVKKCKLNEERDSKFKCKVKKTKKNDSQRKEKSVKPKKISSLSQRKEKSVRPIKEFRELNVDDYKKILDFYNIPIPSTISSMKEEAESILSLKLCRCIKKLGVENEPKSIGICTKTIFNRKGLKRGKFSCSKKQSVSFLTNK
jgi:hypothetical protein